MTYSDWVGSGAVPEMESGSTRVTIRRAAVRRAARSSPRRPSSLLIGGPNVETLRRLEAIPEGAGK
jgi:hypothetical protein